jgi:hypothetical protein
MRRTLCLPQEQDPCLGAVYLATGFYRLGVSIHLLWLRQAWRCERRTNSPRTPEGLGSQPAGQTGESAEHSRRYPERVQQRSLWRQDGLAC